MPSSLISVANLLLAKLKMEPLPEPARRPDIISHITGFSVQKDYGMDADKWREAMELGVITAPKKGHIPYAVVQRIYDDGSITLIQPAGVPPDVRGKNECFAKNRQRKTKAIARLKKKLAEKHGHHTGEECDKCFWDKE